MTKPHTSSRELINITDEAQWLALRKDDITSTKVSALFGLSPYSTEFELYHEQVSGIEIPFKTNDRIEKGGRMERYAAEEVGLRQGWKVEPFKDYLRIPGERMGSSFDYKLTRPDGAEGILEIKAVDFFRHRDTWLEGEAPDHIEIQLQHQLEVADCFDFGVIAAFTGIYDFELYERPRDREFGATLRKRTARFWADVESRREPDVDFTRDDAVIAALFKDPAHEPVDKSGDGDFEAALSRFHVAKSQAKEFADAANAAKAELHYLLGNHKTAYTDQYRLTAGWTKGSADRIAEPGEIIKGRAGYRQCLVKHLQPEPKD